MQTIRTILLLVITIALVAFIAINWETVPVNFWPLDDGTYLHFEWPVGFIVLISFLGGMIPMWLLHKGVRWRFQRRIANLENTVRASASPTPTAVATTTQLDAAAAETPTGTP